jgi:alpha-amylase/alpha-mannosidase (GH57 family)
MRSVKVVLLWHMHQPSYRDPLDGSVVLPWARLHALKDYLGMVRMLEATPGVAVTFNLVPSLIDQLERGARGEADDPLEALLGKPAADLTEADRVLALKGFFMAHPRHLIGRLPRLAELLDMRGPTSDEASLRAAALRFSTQDFLDLALLGTLAWFDLDWQAEDPVVRGLVQKGRNFEERDKARLRERERALLAEIVPAYRRAAVRGQVELSTSPYYHPILPLLCDSEAHHEAHPGAPLPRRYRHPEDAADQIRRALERHEEAFGLRPAGLWPSEGSVSEQAVLEMARAGIRWAASDEGVLARSVGHPLHRDSRGTLHPPELLYVPWVRRSAAGDVALLFRDRALSDLIGFSYSNLDPEHAAGDLLERLRRIGEQWEQAELAGDPVVPVILDGENCWEHYADGGRVFLRTLYRGLAETPGLEAVTVSQALADATPRELPRVFAGSWINADFAVWIGHAEDRRAWDLLGETREALSQAGGGVSPEARERAWEAFRAACGSDWCWWYGGDHHTENLEEFDRLYRRHLEAVYVFLGLPVPAALSETLIAPRLEPRASRPSGAVVPVLDGRITTPEEWVAAGVYRAPLLASAMRRGAQAVVEVRFGIGAERLAVLVQTPGQAREALARTQLAVDFPGPVTLRYRVSLSSGDPVVARERRTGMGWVASASGARAAAEEVLELSLPLGELRGQGPRVEFRVLVLEGDVEAERHPEPVLLSIEMGEVIRD